MVDLHLCGLERSNYWKLWTPVSVWKMLLKMKIVYLRLGDYIVVVSNWNICVLYSEFMKKMETFNLYSIKDLNSDMSCEKVDVIGIICRSFVSEPRRCKNGGKYFLSFTLKGTFHCFLMSGKIYYHIKVRL